MEAEIKSLISSLEAALPHVGALSDAESKHEAIKANIAASQSELDALTAKLKSSTAGLTKAQLDAQKAHDEEIYTKQQALKDLSAQIAAKQSELGEVTAKVSSKQTLHDQLEASIASIQKRFA